MIRISWFVLLVLINPFASAETLTFDQAIEATLSSSLRIKSAEHALQSQVEKRRGAWSGIGPRVSLGYNDVFFERPLTARFMVAVNNGEAIYRELLLREERTQNGSLTIAQPITGLLPLAEVAKNEGVLEDLKNVDLQKSKQDAVFQTGEAYLKAKAAKKLLSIAETSVAAATSSLKDANALERAGRINRGDVLKLELAVSESRARVAQAKAGADIAVVFLRDSMGLPNQSALDLDDELPSAEIKTIPDIEAAQQQALTARYEIKQARLGQDVAGFGVKVAYTQFAPSINVFAKVDRNFRQVTGLAGEQLMRTYGIAATWDIWSNGSSVFAVRQAAEEAQRAEVNTRAAENGIKLDVFQALAQLRAAQESLTLAQTAVKQAEEAYRIEQARFRSGARSATDVILAESSQAGARGRLVSAATDVLVWNMRLQKAMGSDRPTL